ncbi:MAG TPA: RloB family protein [Candidatus Saccharimonadales bacterium]
MARQRLKPWQLSQKSKRRFGVIDPNIKVLIVTEGLTEANYFENYKTSDNLIIIKNEGDSKRSLVEKAIEEKARAIHEEGFDENDHFWVVMDRDVTGSNKKDKDQFNAAMQLAKNNKISVAWSNDAYELWPLLHFQDLRSSVPRHQLRAMLTRHLGERYDKSHPTAYFERLLPNRAKAISRAKSIFSEVEDHMHGKINPSTSIHLLVELLMPKPDQES